MIPFFYIKEAGAKGLLPLSPAPQIPADPPLRCGLSRLAIPHTYSTITIPASLRSDCCSPSLRNAVRLPSGIDVRLQRNTHFVFPNAKGGFLDYENFEASCWDQFGSSLGSRS